MNIIADTNVLLRVLVDDDPEQAARAKAMMAAAVTVTVPTTTLVEMVWVLRRSYRYSRAEVLAAISALADVAKVVTDRSVLQAGLAMLSSGGDFADGVIAAEGRALGGDTFVSFDRDAVARLADTGLQTQLLE